MGYDGEDNGLERLATTERSMRGADSQDHEKTCTRTRQRRIIIVNVVYKLVLDIVLATRIVIFIILCV